MRPAEVRQRQGAGRPPGLRRLAATLLAVAVLLPGTSAGYQPEVHQRLTFHAAKALNRCLEGTDVPPLTPLQVRFIANSNMGLANSNALVRFFRWSYFDSSDRDDRGFMWLINTRFLDHFGELVNELWETRDETDRYEELGRIVSYIQLVTSPSRALPVYTARFWRWSFADRFDAYAVNEAALEAALGSGCEFLADSPGDFRAILFDVAQDTVDAVSAPIDGLPTTWQAFWTPAREPGDFGEYGPAGNNFGRQVEFPCRPGADERCVLLANDPLYAEFALARQLAAVRGTARAMYLMQAELAEPLRPLEPGNDALAE